MDGHNIRLLERIAPEEHKHKIKLLRGTEDVKDPYQGTDKDFRETFEILKTTIANLVEK